MIDTVCTVLWLTILAWLIVIRSGKQVTFVRAKICH